MSLNESVHCDTNTSESFFFQISQSIISSLNPKLYLLPSHFDEFMLNYRLHASYQLSTFSCSTPTYVVINRSLIKYGWTTTISLPHLLSYVGKSGSQSQKRGSHAISPRYGSSHVCVAWCDLVSWVQLALVLSESKDQWSASQAGKKLT